MKRKYEKVKKGLFEVLSMALTVVIGMYQQNLPNFNQCYSGLLGIAFVGICVERYKNNTFKEVREDLAKNYIAICLAFAMLQWLRHGFNFEEYNQLFYVLVYYFVALLFIFFSKKYKESITVRGKKREE